MNVCFHPEQSFSSHDFHEIEGRLSAKSSLSRRLSKDALAATYPAVLRGANRFVVAPICLAAQEPRAGTSQSRTSSTVALTSAVSIRH